MWIFVQSGLHGAEKKRLDNIRPTDKVEDLRVLLAAALGMEVKRMRVFHKGKTLEDGYCLYEYNIKQDEVLQVFPRPPTPEPAAEPAPESAPESAAIPPLVSAETPLDHSDSDDDGPDVIPGTRVDSPKPSAAVGLSARPAEVSPPPVDWQQYREKPYDEEELALLRSIRFPCDKCIQDPRRPCLTCGCHICLGKEDEDKTIVCDECNMFFHWECLDPELKELPEDDWFCPKCKNDTSHVVLPGQKLPNSTAQKKKWGAGNANVGRTKTCTIVGQHHFGSVPGVEVGQTWLFRMQVSESGIHRPPVGGISGSIKTGSQSIVLGGSYKEDVDSGDSFLYTGSGGKDLEKGKGRTTKNQHHDQKMTGFNVALAMTCDVPVSDKGGIAKDWTNSKPVRVVRGYKMRQQHARRPPAGKGKNTRSTDESPSESTITMPDDGSIYAPEKGFRYDGLYKLVRYWPEKGSDGYIVYRYEFRRDDPTPAPWTEEGKRRIEELGLEMIYPDNYQPKPEKSSGKSRKRAISTSAPDAAADIDAADPDAADVEMAEAPAKKVRKVWKPKGPLLELIPLDQINSRLWSTMLSPEYQWQSESEFLEKLVEELKCPVCMDFVHNPVTTICGHNICKPCIEGSLKAFGHRCPSCRTDLEKGAAKINAQLVACIRTFEPNYI
ncbi:hypothetical protein DFH27DRAFT_599204 [Peziza echinospora]|nr:hypothetical protein DFH27DRAFT_599204 [Peziza echinospora]